MRRLRPTDGTPVHRRVARYHVSRCKLGTAPLHATLTAEMGARYTALIAKARAVEDAEDGSVDAGAVLDAAEIAVENTIRDLDLALLQLDRKNPALGAQATTFPGGFGAVIDPEGEAQLTVLPALRVRVDPFKAEPTIAVVLAQLDADEVAFKAAIASSDAADVAYDKAFAEEVSARVAVREQIESAYGRLRDHYKARPMLAETFFAKEVGARRPAKKEAPANPPAPPPGGGGNGGGQPV